MRILEIDRKNLEFLKPLSIFKALIGDQKFSTMMSLW